MSREFHNFQNSQFPQIWWVILENYRARSKVISSDFPKTVQRTREELKAQCKCFLRLPSSSMKKMQDSQKSGQVSLVNLFIFTYYCFVYIYNVCFHLGTIIILILTLNRILRNSESRMTIRDFQKILLFVWGDGGGIFHCL